MDSFDVVVAGGGAAGMCCAASLAEQGLRVALVPEAESYEWSLREEIPAARSHLDELFHHHEWSGGAWLSLIRRLDLSVELSHSGPTEYFVDNPDGLGYFWQPAAAGPAALADFFVNGSANLGMDLSEFGPEYRVLLTDLLSTDLSKLGQFSSVGFGDWLDSRDQSALVSLMLNAYIANLLFMPHDMCSEHLSVAAAVAALRAKSLGGGLRLSVVPNARDGLYRQLADYIESKGGLVERTEYLAGVIIESDRARGVHLTNGEVLTAAAVAVAVPGARVGQYLNALPDVVRSAVDHQSHLTLTDSFVATRLSEPVVSIGALSYVSDTLGACVQAMHPIHRNSPAAALSGEQLLVTQQYWAAAEEREESVLVADQNEATERIFPGFEKVTTESRAWQEKRYSAAAQAHGPKLPRTVEDIAGLWFVGEGSEPGVGLLGSEAGAASGLDGANQIVRSLAR